MQGKDWIAFVYPGKAVSKIANLAAGQNQASLAASDIFQKAVARAPKDPLFLEYISPNYARQLMAAVSLMLPDVEMPEFPKEGAVWALVARGGSGAGPARS